jgi:hypothetical protein
MDRMCVVSPDLVGRLEPEKRSFGKDPASGVRHELNALLAGHGENAALAPRPSA